MEKTLKEKFSVDIILPNYNKFNFVEEAIDSVVNQTFKNWHMYIIDDNSNDNSWSVIKKFSNLYNVTHVRLNKNMGPSFCRNYVMRISNSKYISFIDSDDSWKNKLILWKKIIWTLHILITHHFFKQMKKKIINKELF